MRTPKRSRVERHTQKLHAQSWLSRGRCVCWSVRARRLKLNLAQSIIMCTTGLRFYYFCHIYVCYTVRCMCRHLHVGRFGHNLVQHINRCDIFPGEQVRVNARAHDVDAPHDVAATMRRTTPS